MLIRAFNQDKMSWSYEMYLQDLLTSTDIEGLPFGSVYGSVPAGATSKRHCHHDGEIFIVLAGRGIVVHDGQGQDVGPGDVMYQAPFTVHEIRNESTEPFDIVSLYWENIDAAMKVLEARPPCEGLDGEHLVFCPPPTPNGGLHLGHLAGPYLRADLFARALRSAGRTAKLITGTDDHQSHVAVGARLNGVEPGAFASGHGDTILATLRAAGVELDGVTRPAADPGLAAEVGELLDAVLASPAVSLKIRPTAYCEACEISLHQAWVQGNCPHCGQGCDGEICEACGCPNDALELLDGTCRSCGCAVASRKEDALVLDLNRYADRLRAYLARAVAGSDLRALVDSLLAVGLADYRLTRSSGWGIQVRDPRIGGQNLDAWVDLALTYLVAARREAGEQARISLFLGFDNSFYYAVLLPALAFVAGLEHLLPHAFVTNQFLNLDGAKFSTSRGHAVWADEVLAGSSADAVRLAVLRRAPENRTGNLSSADASRLADDPLLAKAQDFSERLSDLLVTHGTTVPGTGAWSAAHREHYRRLNLATTQLDSTLLPDCFSARGYLGILECLFDQATEYSAAEWRLRSLAPLAEEARTSVAMEFLTAKALAALSFPVMPTFGARLWDQLGLAGEPRREAAWTFLESGHTVPGR